VLEGNRNFLATTSATERVLLSWTVSHRNTECVCEFAYAAFAEISKDHGENICSLKFEMRCVTWLSEARFID